MPPASPSQPGLASALGTALRSAGFRGDIAADSATLAAASTDNSVYEITPEIVVSPRDAADVARLLALLDHPDYAGLPVTARGGGTGTNGQSLNTGVIVNFQRYMTRVLEMNLAERWVEVEPGIVLDDLNARLAGTGLFFAPDTSTSNRCTIGGMVGTDASGKGSRVYGKTSDNVLGLEVALAGGRMLDSSAPTPDWAAPLLRQVASACDSGRAALLARVPAIPRRFTGYDLERARPAPDRLEWWRLFVGAEGTLGLVTRVRLRLVPRLAHKRLVVLAFDGFAHALAAGPALLQHEPVAIEVLDEWVQRLARDAGLMDGLPASVRGGAGRPLAYSFVEIGADDADAADAAARALAAAAAALPGLLGRHVAGDAAEIAQLWSIRAAAVGLLGRGSGARRPVAFVEDCVVPVENLVPFVDGFDRIVRGHGLDYGIYGHVDVGCLHVRPALDVDTDRDLLQRVSDAVYALTKAHGGIFWGEHGKGIRGAYLRDYVGETAYAAFQAIKLAFDPQGRFNPGKLVAANGPLMGIATTPFRPFNAPPHDPLAKAFACNGNAQCLNYTRTTPMCPSFKATGDLRQSPKGRADALRAWHRAEREGAADRHRRAADLFAALDTCLGCKACASSCPVHVDIPAMKSHFLDAYYRTRRRPLADHAAMAVEALAPLLKRMRPLVRVLAPPAFALAERLFGFVDLPQIAARPLHGLGYPVASFRAAAARSRPGNTVLVIEDAFTSVFDTEAVAAVCGGLEGLGYAPLIVTLPPGAKAAHVKGARRRFLNAARRQIEALRVLAGLGRPMVGVDPAYVLMLRQEYRETGLDVPRVQLVEEFLAERAREGDAWPRLSAAPPRKLLLHCTEASLGVQPRRLWQQVFATLGLNVDIVDAGCCGMAGLFGHEARHQEISRTLFASSWAPALAGEAQVLATGFSCRCQVGRLSQATAVHPLAAIRDAARHAA